MERTKKPCLGVVALLLFLLLASAAHGAQPADAKDIAAGDGDGERATVRTGHGHGYSSSHSGGHPSGGTPEQGGAGVVDPRNLNARSHHRRGAATRANVYSSWLVCTLVAGGVMLLL
ncbi:uncharacterized protein LOC103632177 precursor [Zea mays]|uniref:Uncharacterized protein n=1 Tax=Zea mays TaxID=4577 RepID=A0A1D6HWV5_MAIZE|nr:uncharacterized protein LOC103632177 precursor [Zea mays]ONM52700.1 hypothetical protein ZEAMMB73_Zm00001d019320 [Zea mays]|eukprot:XP_008652223.1 uncharacterized protein LOC103632177 isoform X1 [Zea mays]